MYAEYKLSELQVLIEEYEMKINRLEEENLLLKSEINESSKCSSFLLDQSSKHLKFNDSSTTPKKNYDSFIGDTKYKELAKWIRSRSFRRQNLVQNRRWKF